MSANRILLGLILFAFAAGLLKAGSVPSASTFQFVPVVAAGAQEPRFETHFASSRLHTQVHAASSIELKDHRLRAFWFSGSREGAADVTIKTALFDSKNGAWSGEHAITSRAITQEGLHRYIGKLGNPVPARAADGRLWLFYVTVSLGGWAGSSITAISSADEGASWSEPHRLISSPFMNISTLVKSAPFLYADGTMGLPVYHEFFSKFAEILRLDQSAAVIDKQRLAAGGQGTLQPVMLVQDAQRALVLTRYSGNDKPHRAKMMVTEDAGAHWTPATQAPLDNPDAALTGVVLADGRMLAVLNDQEGGRDNLALMLSRDGGLSWRKLHDFEDQTTMFKRDKTACLSRLTELVQRSDARIVSGERLAEYVASAEVKVRAHDGCSYEFSYPYLMQASDGDFDLLYTWNRAFIKHLRFNQAWVDQHLREDLP